MSETDRSSESPGQAKVPRGRGSAIQPPNRFQHFNVTPDASIPPDDDPEEDASPTRVATQYLDDLSSSLITRNDSPDLGFDASINVYRGCEHGCSYCYARPTHEYLGYSAGIDFETRIMVKRRAPELLREELSSTRWKPQVLAMSGVTDPYQPVERKLGLTRRCVEVLAEFRNPLVIVTKNHGVTRDVDHLAELARFDAVAVFLSMTTLNSDLARRMEPRASAPAQRLEAIRRLSEAGVPVGVLAAPMIPGLNDHEVPQILQSAADAGARFCSYVLLRLPLTVAPVFEEWLAREVPGSREKVLQRIRSTRGGKLNDSDFGTRFKGEGIFAEQLSQLFRVSARRAGLGKVPALSTAHFRRPGGVQLQLIGD